MGCVSSTLLDHDDEFSHLAGSGLGHHIVSLTSTTYGLLTLDPPPHADHHLLPPTPPRFTLGSLFPSPLPELRSLRSEPEVINSWELMAGLDTDSFRFSPTPPTKPSPPSPLHTISEIDSRLSRPPKLSTVKDYTNADANNKENTNPNRSVTFGILSGHAVNVLKPVNNNAGTPPSVKNLLDGFEKRCPPNGESKVVIYTTTLRGVRKTFEACNAVRAALEGFGVLMTERDVSMDRGFRDELRELLKGKESGAIVPPRVFVNGRYIGGAEEVLRLHEEGCLAQLLEGLPKATVGAVCEGCGGVRFLPCFQCSGSCKLVMVVEEQSQHQPPGSEVVVRCPDCNENGLVLCPICS